jgi:molybdate transport system substrate-binding protein
MTAMSMLFRSVLAAAACLSTLASPVRAAEIAYFCPPSMRPAVSELAPAFEKATGDRLAISYELMPRTKRLVDDGAAFDVAILTPDLMDDAVARGRIDGATRKVVARTGAGVAVKKGAAKPDISTVAGFKAALLAAKSIGYTADGAAGNAFLAMLDRIGLGAALKSRLVPLPGGGAVAPVAKGEVDVSVTTIPGIMEIAGADLVGPLPDELQSWVVYTAGVGAAARNPAEARALIAFLTSPEAVATMKAKGLTPP